LRLTAVVIELLESLRGATLLEPCPPGLWFLLCCCLPLLRPDLILCSLFLLWSTMPLPSFFGVSSLTALLRDVVLFFQERSTVDAAALSSSTAALVVTCVKRCADVHRQLGALRA
jgi:hypothetical protein